MNLLPLVGIEPRFIGRNARSLVTTTIKLSPLPALLLVYITYMKIVPAKIKIFPQYVVYISEALLT